MVSEKSNPAVVDEFGLSDQPFQKKYNERLEMPISVVGSVFVHVFMILVIIVTCMIYMKRNEKPIIPIMMVDGEDDTGVGSAGSGGVAEPLASGFAKPNISDFDRLNPTPLPQIKEELIKLNNLDPDVTIPDVEAAALSSLDSQLREKMATFGQQKGSGDSTGRGNTGQVGSGPGGFGSDSTRARSMRWVMRFTVADGRDYLRQLAVLKATVLVPIPPKNSEMMIFNDLNAGTPNRVATASEIDSLSRQMRFCDITAKAVEEIGSTFRLNFSPQCFFAFFPKDLEERLAKDEENFKGRKSKDIEETIFKVTVTGNSYSITIVDQKPRAKK